MGGIGARTGAVRSELHVQLWVAAATGFLALLALAASWEREALGSSSGGRVAAVVVSLCLVLATVGAYQFPLHLGRHTKVYLSSVAYYLLAVLVAPPLGATAAGVGSLVGELSVQKRRGTDATDIVAQAGRRVLVVLAGSMVAHLSEDVVLHSVLLVAAALILGIGDIVTFPLIVGRVTGEPPLRIIATAARQAYLVEGTQYLLGLLGALAGAHQFWALALLMPPTVLVYLAFRANARAQDARYAAQEAAEALRESEERYRTLFENASDIIYTHDLAGNFISVNQACERVTGQTREDLLRSTFREIIAPDQLQRAREMIQHDLNRGGPITCELDLIAKAGHRVTVEVNARMIYQGGQPVGVQGIARDITERRRLEQERAQHTRELAARVLQAQEEERKRIARELHDETAQSLSVLLASLDLLEQYIPENDGQLRAGVERVRTLARRALDETRALSHDLRPTILDDAGLVAALEWLAAEYELTYGGSVHVHAESEPAEHLSAEVEVALFRLAQEALTNSGKHAEAHTVHVSLSFPDSIVKLEIQDDGRGFDLERVPGPTREGRLGLYGMRERASLLGGTLRIATDPGRGTRIVAEIPLT